MSEAEKLRERVEFMEDQIDSLEAQTEILKRSTLRGAEKVEAEDDDDNRILEAIRFVNIYDKASERGAARVDVLGAAFAIGVSSYGVRDRFEKLRAKGLITQVNPENDEPGKQRYIVNDRVEE